MSLRKVLRLVDVFLRVPPLFIIDELFRTRLGLPQGETNSTLDAIEELELVNQDDFFRRKFMFSESESPFDSQFYRIFLIRLVKFLVSFLGCLAASCIFMLWTDHLIVLYTYITSVGIVFLSYWANASTMKTMIAAESTMHTCILDDILSLNFQKLSDPDSCFYTLLQNYIAQVVLASLFLHLHLGPRYTFYQKLLPISFMAPSILALLPVPVTVLHHAPVFAALLPLAMVKFILWCSAVPIIQILCRGFQHARNMIR